MYKIKQFKDISMVMNGVHSIANEYNLSEKKAKPTEA